MKLIEKVRFQNHHKATIAKSFVVIFLLTCKVKKKIDITKFF